MLGWAVLGKHEPLVRVLSTIGCILSGGKRRRHGLPWEHPLERKSVHGIAWVTGQVTGGYNDLGPNVEFLLIRVTRVPKLRSAFESRRLFRGS
jgi:hypothetical protein